MPDLRRAWRRPRLRLPAIGALLGGRKALVAGLVAASLTAAVSETGILAIAATAATQMVGRKHQEIHRLGPLPIHLTLGGLLTVALVLATVRLLVQAVAVLFPPRISAGVQSTLRQRLLAAYGLASWELRAGELEGQFAEMMGQQVTVASYGALNAASLIVVSVNLLIMVTAAFALNVIGALVAVSTAGLLFALMGPLNRASRRAAQSLSARQMELAGATGQASRVAEEVQVLGVRGAQRAQVASVIGSTSRAFFRAQALGRLGPALYQSAIYLGIVAGLIVLSHADVSGLASLGAVVLLLVRAGSYGTQAQGQYQAVLGSLPYVERLEEATSRLEQQPARYGNRKLRSIDWLEFGDVAYTYRSDQPVLRDVSFRVNGGETVGVIGPTGAGKSTIVQLLLRLRAPVSGAYLVNGHQADEFSFESWTERVSYLPQQPKLLHASVRDNVRFYRDISDAAVERACREAEIHEEIMSWPGGYDTVVGPRADAVSGGQQQRICLARAIVSQPSLLVLDEPTSALDPRSEALVQACLLNLREHTTLVVVAHRMSTLTICDRVMVVLDGQIDAFDPLPALRSRNAYYREAASISASAAAADRPR